MISKQFSQASQILKGDDDDVPSDEFHQILDNQSPKFRYSTDPSYTQHINHNTTLNRTNTIHNTDDDSVLRGSPNKRLTIPNYGAEYFSNETFKAPDNSFDHQHNKNIKVASSSDLLSKLNFHNIDNNKENVLSNFQTARQDIPQVNKYLSPKTDINFSVNSKYIFNSGTRFNSPEPFETWQKKKSTENSTKQLELKQLAVQKLNKSRVQSQKVFDWKYYKFVEQQTQDISKRRQRDKQSAESKFQNELKKNHSRPSIGERSKTLASQLPYTSVQVHTRLNQPRQQPSQPPGKVQTPDESLKQEQKQKNLIFQLQRTEKKLKLALQELKIYPKDVYNYRMDLQQFCKLLKILKFIPQNAKQTSLEMNYASQLWHQIGDQGESKLLSFQELIRLFMEFDNPSQQPVDIFFCNKLSYEQLKINKSTVDKNPILTRPSLSTKSQRLAQDYRDKLSSQLIDSNIDCQNLYEIKRERSLSVMRQKALDQEMKECSFKPSTNTSSNSQSYFKSVMNEIPSHQVNQVKMLKQIVSATEKVSHKRDKTKDELEWEKSQDECTFTPDLTVSKRRSRSPSISAYYNTQAEFQSVQLVQKGYKKRALVRSTELRQYSKSSWIKSVKEIKQDAHSKVSQKVPILFVDVNIGNQIKRLFIHKGDSSEQVAEEFCLKHKDLNRETMQQFQKQLEVQINDLMNSIQEK